MLAETDINPNVIIVFVAMIIAGLKALIEKRSQQNQPPQAAVSYTHLTLPTTSRV